MRVPARRRRVPALGTVVVWSSCPRRRGVRRRNDDATSTRRVPGTRVLVVLRKKTSAGFTGPAAVSTGQRAGRPTPAHGVLVASTPSVRRSASHSSPRADLSRTKIRPVTYRLCAVTTTGDGDDEDDNRVAPRHLPAAPSRRRRDASRCRWPSRRTVRLK